MHDRIYICHTFYHVYVTCLKELDLRRRAAVGDIPDIGSRQRAKRDRADDQRQNQRRDDLQNLLHANPS